MKLEKYVELAIKAAVRAGLEILPIYNSSEFDVEFKKDKSPLTEADKISHGIIKDILQGSKLPILSEEGKEIDYSTRKKWEHFWLVDPIDGTKEFIKCNGEFTVNIALIGHNCPLIGVIYVPCSAELYVGVVGFGAFKMITKNSSITFPELRELGAKLPIKDNRNEYVVVGSRSHINKETEQHINGLKQEHAQIRILSKGSSLKICRVAEGLADEYPRFGPTMEWDTAAGHA